jgi:hypothetical protein
MGDLWHGPVNGKPGYGLLLGDPVYPVPCPSVHFYRSGARGFYVDTGTASPSVPVMLNDCTCIQLLPKTGFRHDQK